ncbi:MAG: caspase family protein, partial [Proteobacteria bacterium]|nr:caspase family protein [Pseudomonadota bacterium]MBU1611330.1 caspase family protein [Pseudomonadota bacterium]
KPNDSAYMDTLIRAYQKSDMMKEAVEASQAALKKWPNDNNIKQRHQQAEDAYLAHYLALGKQGKVDDALTGLARLSNSPNAAEGRCWLLHKSGKTVDALQLAQSSSSKFGSQYPLIKQAFDGIMDDYVQARYAQFQAGDAAGAVTGIDEMKTRFPGNKDLEAAYKKMFDAILADVTTIQVPEPKTTTATSGGSGQSDSLLAGIRGGSSTQGAVSLTSDVDTNIPKGNDKRPHAVAVVIGNKRYQKFGNSIPDVKFADRDAAFIRKYLEETFGYDSANVIYVQDATQGDLFKIFGSKSNPHGKLYNYVKPGQSEVFIFYSGHGAPDLDKGRAFMVPVDADVSYIANNGYGMDVFYDNLAQLPAKSVTVVMDACFSGNYAEGTLVKNVSPALLKTTSPVRKMKNTVVFSSTGQGQVSNWFPQQSHGLFTYFFLKGLSGAADSNGNKRITVTEMKTYIQDKVPYEARRMGNTDQTPVIVSDLGGDVEIVRLK